MPTPLDIAAQLIGEIPALPLTLARNYVTQALEEISRDYLWSWNIQEGMIIIPQIVTTGTVDVTNFSNQIQFDSTARAVLDPLTLANPPLIERQFRTMGGPIYNLVGYDTGTGIGTLDRIYIASTASAQQYQIYKCYYGPPSIDGITPNTDFLKYMTILDPINGYCLDQTRLTKTREWLNRRDPMRGAQGQMYYAATYRPTPIALTNGVLSHGPTDGQMMYEFWPHPVYGQQLLAQYERLVSAIPWREYLPTQCDFNLVRMKAKEFACGWAMTNAGRIPELRGVNWPLIKVDAAKIYDRNLVGAKRNDQAIMVNVIRPGTQNIMDFFGPVDSNWAQSHGVGSWT